MKTVLFEVATADDVFARVQAVLASGKPDRYAHMSFESAESMARTMTPSRWRVIEVMTGAGPLGVRELARRVGRDVKGVHNDVNALVVAGVVDRADDGKYVFPFDRVKVQFELRAVA
ncbi:transcriptional regulator [Thermomonas sp.]|uniref:HVO_A0114 family putative DNA-binding protein n=1 Tax=Thermomonas sp. TaxID=1971895 RepID=UPI0035B1567B